MFFLKKVQHLVIELNKQTSVYCSMIKRIDQKQVIQLKN
jgi:hypothetical protein